MSPALERKRSVRSDPRPRDAEPVLNLRSLASLSPSVQAGAPKQSLTPQRSTVSSRAGHGHRHAVGEPPLLVRLSSNRTSHTALSPRRRQGLEHLRSGLSLHRSPVAATSRHGTVAGSARPDDHHRDGGRCNPSLGDPSSSLEFSSRRRAMSREPSLGLGPGPEHLRSGLNLHRMPVVATSRHDTVARSARRDDHHRDVARRSSGRGDPSLSLEFSSRRLAVSREPECSSSSNTLVTIRSRIRLHGEVTKPRLRRAVEEEASTSRRRRKGSSSSSSAGWGGSSERCTRSTPPAAYTTAESHRASPARLRPPAPQCRRLQAFPLPAPLPVGVGVGVAAGQCAGGGVRIS